MDAEPPGVSSARRWSAAAGGYAFVAAVVLFEVVFDPLADTFGQLLGLPRLAALAVVATPLWAFGAVMWFGIVEERAVYTYPAALAYGLSTTVLSVLTVVGLLGLLFGPVVYIDWFAAAFLLVVSLPVVLGVALTTMLVRRRRLGDA